ncbi:hypothetical protein V5O48_015913 [Marasmius crinis-equi]|uniref:CxC1-like cysteine cluster associated with KDZ transposases domain-containing protein n=1 Tax=Marasmius crinis-equi TaxID=585013 RepID=A0ABR3ET66_9AGAR
MSKRKRGGGLSNNVNFLTAVDDDTYIEESKSHTAPEERWSEAQARWRISVISYQQADLFDSSGHGTTFMNVSPHDPNATDDDDWDDTFFPLPGEEGAINSNAGGELSHQTFLNSLLEQPQARADMRTRHDRTEKQTESWKEQMPRLVDRYLAYQQHGCRNSSDDSIFEGKVWSIPSIDFTEYIVMDNLRHIRGTQSINESLVYHGLLGGSPDQPNIAFPFDFLETFRQIHRVCPRFTLNGLSRVLTNTHRRFPNPTLEDQLRVAYDTYLAIQRVVQSRVDVVLNRDPRKHFIDNVCPPCLGHLEGEDALDPAMLISMDGNASLKMVDSEKKFGTARLDTRQLIHPRWLDAEFVDRYKDEVTNARKAAPAPTKCDEDNSPCEVPEIDDDENTELDEHEFAGLADLIDDTCVERWKAAGPDTNKRMYSFFKISGVFLSVCRHGHVLVICDMRRSGELMKYPLANVKVLLDRYRKDLGLAYDIMCAFYKTLLRSAKLRDQVLAFRLRGVVPAFHGHAHNHKCQVSWHPMYVNGAGIEDFEECERTFSESNKLAASTRLATEFHRHQSILEHFEFHDQDKHISSGNFIYQNYRDALGRLAADEPLFNELCEKWNVSVEDCERFLQDEREHFTKDFVEPPDVSARLDYVEMLQSVDKQKRLYEEAHIKHRNGQNSRKLTRKQVDALQSTARAALLRFRAAEEDLTTYEEDNQHFRQWKPTDADYRRALERLERLVVQRLLELTKLNMSGVGYRQREKISQALRARAKAIQNAFNTYNNAALAMDPPRPILDWKSILDMVVLADFDLLKNTHLDLSSVPWVQPHHRECMRLYFRIRRAREEIKRLNVEIPRLLTAMLDDHADHCHAIARAEERGDYKLAAEIFRRRRDMNEINGHIAIRLVQTSELKGFSGTLVPGQRKGRDPSITASAPLAPWAPLVLGLTRPDESPPTIHLNLSEVLPVNNGDSSGSDQLLDYFEDMFTSKTSLRKP